MAPDRSFRARLLSREVLGGTFLNMGSTLSAEIVATAGFDWVGIDLEHGAGGELEALSQLQAISSTSTAGLVRVEESSAPRIAHALDSGAAGVIVPRIESATDAAEAASFCRYSGKRGVARFNRSWRWGHQQGALSSADEATICCIQIELRPALQEVEAIAALPGVDVLFVGPADLAHSLGIEGDPLHPDLMAAAATVAAAARAHRKVAGVLTGSVQHLSGYREMGFTLLGCLADSALLMQKSRDVVAEISRLRGHI